MHDATTRDEAAIVADMATARAAYLAITNTAPAAEVRAAYEVVAALQRELAAYLSAGAKPCRACGLPAYGMLKTPGFEDRDGLPVPPKYEVGCTRCPAAARGISRDHAVERWNASEYV